MKEKQTVLVSKNEKKISIPSGLEEKIEKIKKILKKDKIQIKKNLLIEIFDNISILITIIQHGEFFYNALKWEENKKETLDDNLKNLYLKRFKNLIEDLITKKNETKTLFHHLFGEIFEEIRKKDEEKFQKQLKYIFSIIFSFFLGYFSPKIKQFRKKNKQMEFFLEKMLIFFPLMGMLLHFWTIKNKKKILKSFIDLL
jgi:hypothetical protein